MTPPPEFRVDPDVDLRIPADRAELTAHPAAVLGAIAAGGVLGGLARAGVQAAFPYAPTGFPWATFGINLTGCLLIGVLMAVIGARPVHPLVRPFLGVGVLGGFTTFSAYAVDAQRRWWRARPAPRWRTWRRRWSARCWPSGPGTR